MMIKRKYVLLAGLLMSASMCGQVWADQAQVNFNQTGDASLMIKSGETFVIGQLDNQSITDAYAVVQLDALNSTREAGTGSGGSVSDTELSPIGTLVEGWGFAEIAIQCYSADVVAYQYGEGGKLVEVLSGTVKTTFCPAK